MNEENMVETGQGAGAAATDAVSLVKKIIRLFTAFPFKKMTFSLLNFAFFKIILTENVKINNDDYFLSMNFLE